jgi:hypothetical protein
VDIEHFSSQVWGVRFSWGFMLLRTPFYHHWNVCVDCACSCSFGGDFTDLGFPFSRFVCGNDIPF